MQRPRPPETVNPHRVNQINRFYPAMTDGRCLVPPARRDGSGQLRSHFTSAYLPHLPKAVLDLSPLRPRAPLLQCVLSTPRLWPKSARGQPASSAKPRGTTRSSRPFFPSYRSLPQDAPGDRLVQVKPTRDPLDRVLRLASLHRLRPTRAIRSSVSLKRRSRMLHLETQVPIRRWFCDEHWKVSTITPQQLGVHHSMP
jgi:hypothetical protein